MTQEDVGQQLNVTRQTISNWENDKNYPDLTQLVDIARVYQLSLDGMLREDTHMVVETQRRTWQKGWRRGLLVGATVLALLGMGGIYYTYTHPVVQNDQEQYLIYTNDVIAQKMPEKVHGYYDIVGTSGWASFGTGNVQKDERYRAMALSQGGSHVDSDNNKTGAYTFVKHKVDPVAFKDGKAQLTEFGTYLVPSEIPRGKYQLSVEIPQDGMISLSVNGESNTDQYKQAPFGEAKYHLLNGQPYQGKYNWQVDGVKHPALKMTMTVNLSQEIKSIEFANWNAMHTYLIPNSDYTITLEKVE